MDVKGQYKCERYFVYFMWVATVLSFVTGLALDNIRVMFGLFAAFLLIALAACLPEWPYFNSDPLAFRRVQAKQN